MQLRHLRRQALKEDSQQALRQAFGCDGEVHQGRPRAHLGCELNVRPSRRHEEACLRVGGLGPLGGLLSQRWAGAEVHAEIQDVPHDGAEVAIKVFEEHRAALLLRHVQLLPVLVLGRRDHQKVVLPFDRLEPCVRLPLRVDAQRPPVRQRDDRRVREAVRVVGQSALQPVVDVQLPSEEPGQGEVSVEGDVIAGRQLVGPLPEHSLPRGRREGAQMRHEPGSEECIAASIHQRRVQLHDLLRPCLLLRLQGGDELDAPLQVLGHPLLFGDEALQLGLLLGQHLLALGQGRRRQGPLSLRVAEPRRELLGLLLLVGDRPALRRHCLLDLRVLDEGLDPLQDVAHDLGDALHLRWLAVVVCDQAGDLLQGVPGDLVSIQPRQGQQKANLAEHLLRCGPLLGSHRACTRIAAVRANFHHLLPFEDADHLHDLFGRVYGVAHVPDLGDITTSFRIQGR
mmetsp:Transcript_1989/g.7604  ORF Transcript_1989/g.7604 Transcript_1989/m.7604 type:complete len:455 (-) Transcript_1989:8438-9802(-)